MRGVRVLLAAALVVLVTPAVPATRAAAAPRCDPATAVGSTTVAPDGVPWPQRRYGPQRLAGIADGAGVVVAVLDSGVDVGVAPLRDRVLPGADELDGGDGRFDCVGHGTAVASIIAAAAGPDTPFAGLAPAARILPVRVTESEYVAGAATGRAGTLPGLVAAIRWAVGHGATVLNLSLAVYEDAPSLRDAIAYALGHDVVVVAAVGNGHRDGGATAPSGTGPNGTGPNGTGAGGPDATPYPAAYPGVIGVGSVGPDGQRSPTSPLGPFVDIVAPGSAVPALTRGGRLAGFDGSSFAAPFVSATAALIRQQRPGLSAGEVAARILNTADPSPDGPRSPGYGAGILNPYRAVTEDWPATGSARPAAPVGVAVRPAAVADRVPLRAGELAGAGAGLTALILIGAVALTRGARRGWRPGRN